MTAAALPYGPETPAIRRFLVRFAGLGARDRGAIVSAWVQQSPTPAYVAAEAMLAHTIERSGREPARDALSGPLLQLVRREGTAVAPGDPDALDPVAEPVLAALLALLVRDLLEKAAFNALYAACAGLLPLEDIVAAGSP
jgi:hypothetical protein